MKQTLEKFRQAKKMQKCRICNLPEAARKQLENRSRHISLAVVLEWLKVEWQINITLQEYTLHAKGGHATKTGARK